LIDLTIRFKADPAGEEYVFLLQSDDGTTAASSNLPDPRAALAAVQEFGEQVFFPQPGLLRGSAPSNTAARRWRW